MKRPSINYTYRVYSLYVLIYVLFGMPTAFADTKLRLNSGTLEPFVTADGGGFYGKLVQELFSRIYIDAKVIPLASARSILNVNEGIDDGVIARTKGIEKKYTNLIRVPGAIVKFKFVAYSLDKKIEVTDWDSFKDYSVGIVRGWKIYENNVTNAKRITKVTGAEQLFNLLLNGRSDLILYEYQRGTWWNNHLDAKAHLIGSPIAEKDMFIYMHKKHAELVPKIAKALADMKADGSYQRIKDETLSQY